LNLGKRLRKPVSKLDCNPLLPLISQMATSFQIARATAQGPGLNALRAEAACEGFQFIERLLSDWETGSNRFDQPGECLLGAFSGAQLIAVGGLNRDPCVDADTTGRIRHLYVRKSARRHGLGSALLRRLLDEASDAFKIVRLRTTPGATAFYLHHGFLPVADATAPHVKILR
jgi:GNAT superfamily N-acetyltransferase